MKKAFLLLAVVLIATLTVLTIKFLTFRSKQIKAEQADAVELDKVATTERFAELIKLRTISYEDRSKIDPEEFLRLHEVLEKNYPLVHKHLRREKVAHYSLLYTWQGTDPKLAAALLMGHFDVVPAEDGWKHDPFSAEVKEGYIWGRGTLDDKVNVAAILEAVEKLLSEGFQPRRTILLAFGHDEEIGGSGAQAVAKLLQERGQKIEYVLDEGSIITEGVLDGITRPVALIGIAEKGFLSIRLHVETSAGHSSIPQKHTAIGLLARALAKLEEHQMPARIDGATAQMLEFIGPEMNLKNKMTLANLWLFSPLVKKQFLAKPLTAATLRTTTAITTINGGIKENVLPKKATATVNFRILPGDSIETVLEHVQRTIADPQIKLEVIEGAHEPPMISDITSPAFAALQRSIMQVFSDTIVAPSLVLAATDARHFGSLSKNVYRFCPLRLNSELISSIHGTNERISIDNYLDCIRFYRQLIINTAQ
ncbi:MAG: M20 family peptidase [Acidobacteriota bacterium]|nr:M20 family peptidase [Blastocatellia bacterium]MDW8413203.1 M20 family peptidase [Acidobacteriota bacterium]